MSIINIASLGRDVELKPYTRAIARAVNEELLKDVTVSAGNAQDMTINAINADRSEQVLVSLMTGLTNEEVDSMTNDEYISLKTQIQKSIQGEKKA